MLVTAAILLIQEFVNRIRRQAGSSWIRRAMRIFGPNPRGREAVLRYLAKLR